MYNHAPANYDCPFCKIAQGFDIEAPWTNQQDVVYRDTHVTAFISAAWWDKSAAHVLIIPNVHYENIYDLPIELATEIQRTAQKVALAFKEVYNCAGTSTRQHNEPAGYQEVWHYHFHVFPRYPDDNLYGEPRRITQPQERLPYAAKLRAYLNSF